MALKSYAPSVIEWTHVADATPENSDYILVINRGRVEIAYVWSGRFKDNRDRKISPTHWAYLPKVS
jgi:hypothetical protein